MTQEQFEIGYTLSPWALKYVDAQRAQTMIRDPHRTCSEEGLRGLLLEYQLPVSDALIDYEKNLGGWCSTHSHSMAGYGIYLSLQNAAEETRTANGFRRKTWLFEGAPERPSEDGDWPPIWGKGYPRAFFLERHLIPAGMGGESIIYFLGEAGEVYVYLSEVDQLLLLAGSGRTLIESFGLRHQRENHSWYEAHICADVSALVADALDVPLFEPACDHLFKWWASDTVQIRLVPDYAPCIMGTHIACREEGEFLRVMELVRKSLEVGRVRIWEQANNIMDDRGRHALVMAGVDCDILRGAAPGHYECAWDEEKEEEYYRPSQYDLSMCDPKNWHIPGPNLGVSRT